MSNPSPRSPTWLDLASIGASFACLVHCLLPPLLLAIAPALAGLFELPEYFHLAAILFAMPASALAMSAGFRRHGAILPATVAAFGLALLLIGTLAGLPAFKETGFSVAGSLLLAGAHLRNWRLAARATRKRTTCQG